MEGIQPTLLVPQSPRQSIVTVDMGVTQGKDVGDPKPHTSPGEQEWGHGAFHLRIPQTNQQRQLGPQLYK